MNRGFEAHYAMGSTENTEPAALAADSVTNIRSSVLNIYRF